MAVTPRATHTSNGAGEIVAHPPTTPVDTRHHGAPVRGLDVVPSSSFLEGRFGRMFRHLPVFDHADSDLVALAHRMVQRREKEKPEGEEDDDENTAIAAGYTYLGQFIDHDLTFDPASSLQRQNDPDALHDFRTPRFDLDSMYGRGPADQPYLYRNDAERVTAPGAQRADLRGIWFLLGEPVARPGDPTAGPDLPRTCRALPMGRAPRLPAARGVPAGRPGHPARGDLRDGARRSHGHDRAPAAAVLRAARGALHARRVLGRRLPLRALDDPALLPHQRRRQGRARRAAHPDLLARGARGRRAPEPQRLSPAPARLGDRVEVLLRHPRRRPRGPALLQDRSRARQPARTPAARGGRGPRARWPCATCCVPSTSASRRARASRARWGSRR